MLHPNGRKRWLVTEFCAESMRDSRLSTVSVERWSNWTNGGAFAFGGMAQSLPCLVGGTVSAEDVDRYLRGLEEPKRSSLQALRRTILEIIPDAEEVISYRVPAFRVGGATVAGFATFKKHLSYLPFS